MKYGTGVSGLMRVAKEHWKECLPRMYLRLLKAGTLDARASEAATATSEAIDLERERLLKAGESTGAVIPLAWELHREDSIILPAEPDYDLENHPARKEIARIEAAR